MKNKDKVEGYPPTFLYARLGRKPGSVPVREYI